jgi:hypothetical protein
MGSGTSIGGSGSGGGSGGAATLDHDTARKIGKARKWLLAISILRQRARRRHEPTAVSCASCHPFRK